MTRLLVAVVVAAVAVAVALVLRRRQRLDAPTQGGWTVPTQLDRADFAQPERPWLVATFSSATCQTCADVVRKAAVLASGDVAVTEVEYGAQTELHRRYRVDAVPMTVIADRDGVVRASFIGPVTATDLWAAVAEVRSPGSSPEPGLGRPSG
jgi:glucose/arabinose dehydrogenase